MHPRLVSQETVPKDAGGCHQDSEDIQSLQREAEIRADEDGLPEDASHDQIKDPQSQVPSSSGSYCEAPVPLSGIPSPKVNT